MGDRANIVICQRGDSRLFLCAHFSGYRLPAVLAAALKRGGGASWGLPDLLARIIFCEMVKGQEIGIGGFGITTSLEGNDYPLLVVNPAKGTVSVARPKTGGCMHPGAVGLELSFSDFLTLPFEDRGPEEAWDIMVVANTIMVQQAVAEIATPHPTC